MKATLEFNLPEEKNELRLAEQGGLYFSHLCTIREALRQINKYRTLSGDQRDLLNEIQRIFIDTVEYSLEEIEQF
ncbi:MAG: hypothetical protein WC441_05195 [Patescibacteria group bacterium]